MKNKEVLNHYRNFEKIIKDDKYKNLSFNFFLVKNKKIFEEHIKIMQEITKPDEKFTEYENKRIELLKQYSTDKNGKVNFKDLGGGNIEYILNEDTKDEFYKKLKELQEQYKDEIEKQLEKIKQYNDFLEKDVEIDFVTIKKDDLPNDITSSDLDLIIDFVV